MKVPPQRHSGKGVFEIQRPVSGVNSSNNISITQTRGNMRRNSA